MVWRPEIVPMFLMSSFLLSVTMIVLFGKTIVVERNGCFRGSLAFDSFVRGFLLHSLSLTHLYGLAHRRQLFGRATIAANAKGAAVELPLQRGTQAITRNLLRRGHRLGTQEPVLVSGSSVRNGHADSVYFDSDEAFRCLRVEVLRVICCWLSARGLRCDCCGKSICTAHRSRAESLGSPLVPPRTVGRYPRSPEPSYRQTPRQRGKSDICERLTENFSRSKLRQPVNSRCCRSRV